MSSEVTKSIEALPAAFLPEKAGTAKALFQLDLRPDVTVTMDGDDFVALFSNELDPVKAFMGGKIKVSGNLGLVMQLLNWFDRGA
jgi:putative sterol carrier protein